MFLFINHDRICYDGNSVETDETCVLQECIVSSQKVTGVVKCWIPCFKASKWDNSKRVIVVEGFKKPWDMLHMVRDIHLDNPGTSREVKFFGWLKTTMHGDGKAFKAIKLADHLLA